MTNDCGPCFPNHAHALSQLHSVYSSPALSHLDDNGNNGFFQSIGNAVVNFINQLSSRAGGNIATLLFVLIVATLVALVVWWTVRRPAPRPMPSLHEAPGSVDPGVEWNAALAAAAAADYREAVRRAFRSALLAVAIRGRLAVDPAWTNRELLQRANADPALLACLAPAAHIFEVSWYSGRPTTESAWLTQHDRCKAILSLAQEGAAA
jgi:Domain of unknown function (DUF4129)